MLQHEQSRSYLQLLCRYSKFLSLIQSICRKPLGVAMYPGSYSILAEGAFNVRKLLLAYVMQKREHTSADQFSLVLKTGVVVPVGGISGCKVSLFGGMEC